MQQSALTLVVPIALERLEAPASWPATRARLVALRDELSAARAAGGGGTEITRELRALLAVEGGIHYLSFFAIDAAEHGPAYLVLEVNCDGSAHAQQKRLATLAPLFLLKLFEDCPELRPGVSALPGFLKRHALPADAFYVAFPGAGVRQIQAEQRLRLEARGRFEASGSAPPSGVCPRASTPGSLRLAPTSASSLWRTLQEAFGQHALVQGGRSAPLRVRWSLSQGGWRERLELWGRRLAPALLLAAALEGFCSRERGAGLDPLRSTSLALALGAAVVWLLVVLVVTVREAPRSLLWRGRWLVLRGALGEVGRGLVSLAVLLGLVLLVGALAQRLSAAQAVVAGLLLGAGWLGLSRAGLGSVASAAVALVLLLADLLPSAWLALIPAAALGLVCVGLILLSTALLYVMAGRALARLFPLACVLAAGLHLAWYSRSRALTGADLLELSVLGAVALSGLLLLGLGWVGAWLFAVRRLEQGDADAEAVANQPAAVRWDVAHLDQIQEQEDRQFQNHLITVSRLKPGALRLCTLRRVLRAVQLSAWLYANRGHLGGIRTLHFGRFLVLPDQERLLFIGNYDGGYASYLHEFNAVAAVTAVWSNCVGFPSSQFLVGGGAADEQRFKAFGRRSQVPTLGWYSAYPELSIGDIEAAARVREDLARPLDDPSTWQGRWRARFGSPLREADCDLTLRRL